MTLSLSVYFFWAKLKSLWGIPTPVKRMCAVTIETNGGMLLRIINEKGRGQNAAGMATKLHAMAVAHGLGIASLFIKRGLKI